jgi:hypothetical protein
MTESNPRVAPDGTPPLRCEPRSDAVRIVEYTRFPRFSTELQPKLGFTRDLSPTGLCIGADHGEEIGALLRLCVRDVAGTSSEPIVARVVWTQPARDDRHWIGLSLLADSARERAA